VDYEDIQWVGGILGESAKIGDDWLFSNPPTADDNRNDHTGFHKNVPNGISGCKKTFE